MKYSGKIKDFFNQSNNKNMDNRFPFKLGSIDATEILNVACDSWKKKLADSWGSDLLLNHSTLITEDFYKEMREACTDPQHKLFDEIFGKDTVVDFSILNDEDIFHLKTFTNNNYLFKGRNPFTAEVQTVSLKYQTKVLNRICEEHEVVELRLATEEESKLYYQHYQHFPKWSINDTVDGEPVWSKNDILSNWLLRYSDGKGGVYNGQYKEGSTTSFSFYKKFDLTDLPVSKIS